MYKHLTLAVILVLTILLASCQGTAAPSPALPPAAAQNSPTPDSGLQTPDSGPRTPPKSLPVGEVKKSSAGNVDVDIKLSEVKDNNIVFKVTMDTHSVDLDKFDLSALSQIRDDKGNQSGPASWQSPPGGHHRSGDLVFPLPPSVSKGEAAYIELVIKDVTAPQRIFKWELK